MSEEVFVIEDDTHVRALLRIMLEDAGYTVYEAPDGMSGLDRLRTHPRPLVVVLDWHMPGMDGIEVLQALAMDAPIARRHTYILLTALYDAPDLDISHLSPDVTVSVMGKPFDMHTFLSAVARAATQVAETSAAAG